MIEEIIDMQNENALIALAYIKENDNPVQVFCNYVVICLMKAKNNKLRYDELFIEIEKFTGLKMSVHMLKMCCSILKKEHKLKKLPNGAGYELIDFCYDIKNFETQRDLLQIKEKKIINQLINYVKDFNLEWDYELARGYLTDFLLNKGNAASIFSYNQIKPVKSENKIKPEWYIGKYVTDLLGKSDDLSSYLIDIVNGLMIYIGVYEAQNYKQTYTQKFNGTKFFFDTKLILRLMGYSWQLETESAKELYNLIKSYKGEIYVFEHTIGEISSALNHAYDNLKRHEPINDTELRIGVELNNRDIFDLEVDKNNDYLRELIEHDLKIKIQPNLDWGNEQNHKYNLDTEKIKEYIIEQHPNWKYRAIANDVDIINYINILRKGNYTQKYGGIKKLPVFITSNTFLVYDIRAYIEKFGEEDRKIANWNTHALPIITDNMLMCRLWVPKAGNMKSIPELTLARNAYAAQQVDFNFFEKLKYSANKLKSNHKIDLVNISIMTKEKLEEIVIRNISGDMNDLTDEVLASSADELIKIETLDLKRNNKQLKEERKKQKLFIQHRNEQLIEAYAQKYVNKFGVHILLIWFGKIWWILSTAVFAFISFCGLPKLNITSNINPFFKLVFTTIPIIAMIVLEIAKKLSEKSENVIKERLIDKALNIYCTRISNKLTNQEKEFEKEILDYCINHANIFHNNKKDI